MINRKLLCSFLTAMVLIVGASESYAVGLGFSFGVGRENWDDMDNRSYEEEDRKISNIGFVIDTAVARDKIFNYRFTFMKEENEADGGAVDMHGISMTHDFGIAVYRYRVVRVWVGLEVKAISYNHLSSSSSGNRIEGDAIGLGVGPVVGVNVHLPSFVSFSFTAAYHIIGMYSLDFTTEDRYEDLGVDSTNGLYWNASIIFRIDE